MTVRVAALLLLLPLLAVATALPALLGRDGLPARRAPPARNTLPARSTLPARQTPPARNALLARDNLPARNALLPARTTSKPALRGGAARAAAPKDGEVTVSKYSNQPYSDGAYRYEYALSDGSVRYEEGALQNAGVPGKEYLTVRGTFSRPSFDGQSMEQVMYYADEGGFHVARMAPPALGAPPAAALIASLVG